MVMSMMVIVIWIFPLDMNQRIKIPYILQRKEMKFLPTDMEWNIIDYSMVLELMLCYMHPHLINMPIWNTIINIITFLEMVTFKYQTFISFRIEITFCYIKKWKMMFIIFSNTWLVPDFGDLSLDTDPNFSRYWHFYGIIIKVRTDINLYKRGTQY